MWGSRWAVGEIVRGGFEAVVVDGVGVVVPDVWVDEEGGRGGRAEGGGCVVAMGT